MPTAILYLRDPERFAVWLPILSEGLQLVTGFNPGRAGSAEGYQRYNEAAQRFRKRYGLAPQALDLVLWKIARDARKPSGDEETDILAGEDAQGDGAITAVEVGSPWAAVLLREPPPYTTDDLRADTFLDERFWSSAKALLVDKRQLILYGPPGTGKTWVAKKFARHWIGAASDPRGEVRVVQFHPSYSYEEFVEGIRPVGLERPGGGRDISYEVRDGAFKSFCRDASEHPERSYVMIVDEINRGDLARIFGELLYLLEYRGESVRLPYSGEEFAVPENLYVIGTMNSADRSIALVDHALRRRFHFIDMRPDPDALRSFHEKHGNTAMLWTADLLDSVNKLLDEDGVEWHLHIGHSHLMSAVLDDDRLGMIWEHSIMPALAEYFHRRSDRLQGYALGAIKASLGVGR